MTELKYVYDKGIKIQPVIWKNKSDRKKNRK